MVGFMSHAFPQFYLIKDYNLVDIVWMVIFLRAIFYRGCQGRLFFKWYIYNQVILVVRLSGVSGLITNHIMERIAITEMLLFGVLIVLFSNAKQVNT